MEAIINENSTDLTQRLPWSRPEVRRLVISLETSAPMYKKTGSWHDGCDFGPYLAAVLECD